MLISSTQSLVFKSYLPWEIIMISVSKNIESIALIPLGKGMNPTILSAAMGK